MVVLKTEKYTSIHFLEGRKKWRMLEGDAMTNWINWEAMHMKSFIKKNKFLGTGIIGLAAIAAGCRSFEYTKSQEAVVESIAYNPEDAYTSIEDIIQEASRYNPEDTYGKDISDFILPCLKGIKHNILLSQHEAVSKEVQYAAGLLHKRQHPLSLLLEDQLKKLSYLVACSIDKRTNVIRFKGGSTPEGAAAAG